MLRTDLRSELPNLHIPTLIVHGGMDDIVDSRQADLVVGLPSVEVVLMPDSRHFPFLDEPEIFNDVLLRFLTESSLTTIPAGTNHAQVKITS
jgi:pimeloyl-ACP methyl ester carboxylesterase